MKESISYTFVLNIVIVFIFMSFAIIMGIISYYKAFRANTIIVNAIEKYEGYNCLAKEEIARKLNNIGYITPFNVKCKEANCELDDTKSYSVVSYNLDFDSSTVAGDDINATPYICKNNECKTNKNYQYGVYTYMYIDIPVISKLIRMSVYSKTKTMYEFRDYYQYEEEEKPRVVNNMLPGTFSYNTYDGDESLYFYDVLGTKNIKYDDKEYTKATDLFARVILKKYTQNQIGGNYFIEKEFEGIIPEIRYNARLRAILDNVIKIDANSGSLMLANKIDPKECGYERDYKGF